ncbi:calcium/sodium antiporter [Parendozoicomonas haliclonae]|nr:calcium/sodium antiporter [Parendozoicomonas haliclonae]
MLLLAIAALIVGLIALMWSADHFVNSAAVTARHLGMSPMLIGLTIVAIGTSAPEILVSLTAALKGSGDLAVGNALGSNIANIGMVLGLTLLIAPIRVNKRLMGKELPLLAAITLVSGAILYDNSITFIEGVLMIAGLIAAMVLINYWQKKPDDEPLTSIGEESEDEIQEMPQTKATLILVGSLALLLVSSNILVESATYIARYFGISELIIGLTIVAIGTSLPELAASVASALKGHPDMALGNIIGSNMFNLLAVMAVPGLVAPGSISPEALIRDYPAMCALTLLLMALTLIGKKPRVLGRISGLVLCSGYIAYAGYIAFGGMLIATAS